MHLAPAFTKAQRDLGATHIATPGQPKRSLLSLYFRWATVDGMIDPFGLEVLVNPDLVPIERPFVVAHEWGHLAGWARESEASLVGWTTCMEGDETAQYSGVAVAVPAPARATSPLTRSRASTVRSPPARVRTWPPSPRASPPVSPPSSAQAGAPTISSSRPTASPEGVRSYDEVVTLVIGTRLKASTPQDPAASAP